MVDVSVCVYVCICVYTPTFSSECSDVRVVHQISDTALKESVDVHIQAD